jgi:PHD/YefM family antitoxin component YafN of YafNO toxin-antitoxin module
MEVMNKTISTTEARKDISKLVKSIREDNAVFAIGRRDVPEVLMIKFPSEYNKELNEITNFNAYSGSFDFLADEPELYTRDDIKFKYEA